MQPRIRRNFFSLFEACLGVCVLLCSSATLRADPAISNVLIRENFSRDNRHELVLRLRAITGWSGLDFDSGGALRTGSDQNMRGSARARALISAAMAGNKVIVLEETPRGSEVVFCQVVPARWTRANATRPPAHVIQIDFNDFKQVLGDRRAREAFNVVWGVLHELDHVVNDSTDSTTSTDAGECEASINAMRRELNLPERAEYFYQLLANPGNFYPTRLVRMAFRQRDEKTRKTNRYWLLWDAAIVGGLKNPRQIASTR